jgi:hypothetical protein
MRKKIFISHSSKDIEFVEGFVDKVLKLGMGVSEDRIFCSSMEGHGIRSGEYIPDILKEELQKSGLAFLFLSKNYKESEVCLNEMGAAWFALEKSDVIPILLPDVDFTDLGFIDTNRLGVKITDKTAMISLIQDQKGFLNMDFKIPLLTKHLDDFLAIEWPELTVKLDEPFIQNDHHQCFEISLIPFGEVSQKVLPHLEDGIHHIEDRKTINKLFKELSTKAFQRNLWFAYSGGDMYIEQIKLLSNGDILLDSWENNISELWISINCMQQYEFILFKSMAQKPFEINSDVSGISHHVGVLSDGTKVSDAERGNGYAIVNGDTIDLAENGVSYRYNYPKDNWIFLSTRYHKIGNNLDESEDYCRKLDSGEVIPTEEALYKFVRSLRNHSTVIKYL